MKRRAKRARRARVKERRRAFNRAVEAAWRMGGVDAARALVDRVGRTARCPVHRVPPRRRDDPRTASLAALTGSWCRLCRMNGRIKPRLLLRVTIGVSTTLDARGLTVDPSTAEVPIEGSLLKTWKRACRRVRYNR